MTAGAKATGPDFAAGIPLTELAENGSKAAIVGSSFIGLEAAAALRAREVEVTVISPDAVPFEQVFGRDVGAFVQSLHERNGVRFRLGVAATKFDGRTLTLADGEPLDADFVLVGVGVRPRVSLAERAGIAVQDGVIVDAQMQTSLTDIFAAATSRPTPIR